MPWVLEETFAAGGLDLHAEVALRRLDPFYRIRWAGEERGLDFVRRPRPAARRRSRASPRATPRALDGFLAAMQPIYEEGILGAGRRPFARARFAALPAMRGSARPCRCTASSRATSRNPRVREAFSFHSLFIGGDPFRVPAIYGALVYLQLLDGGWYADGGVYALVEAMARPLDVRCGDGVERIEHRGGRRDRRAAASAASGSPADVVVSNADVLRTHELLGRPGAAAAPAANDVVLPALPRLRPAFDAAAAPHAARRPRLPRLHPRRHAPRAGCPRRSRPTSTRRRAPRRRWRRPAATRSRVLLPVPNLRAADRLGARRRPAARRARRRPRADVRARRACGASIASSTA